jgi:dihydrofolate reductase
MARLRSHIAISLDGYTAGPDQSVDDPLGRGGMQLHDWAVANAAWRRAHGREEGERNASSDVLEQVVAGVGAYVMGRNMFGGGSGPWGEPRWDGWWGEEPPFHTPVFVLTHHAREPQEMQGGTTFHFVTDGLGAALEQAFAAAGGQDVQIGGGADVVRQALAAGRVDELMLHVVPILLGGGTRLFDGIDPAALALEPAGAVHAPGVTHVTYRRA